MSRWLILLLASTWALAAPLNAGGPAATPVKSSRLAPTAAPAKSKKGAFKALQKANPFRLWRRADAALTEWSIRFSSRELPRDEDLTEFQWAPHKTSKSSIAPNSEHAAAP